MKRIFPLFKLVPKVISWIHQVFNLSETQPLGKYLTLIKNIEKIFRTRGPLAGLTFVKSVRVNLMNYWSGNSLRAPGVRCTKDGIPLILSPFINEIRRGGPRAVLQVLNTVLFMTRALNLGVHPDTRPITEPTNVVSPDLSKYMKDFWRELGYKPSMAVPNALRWKRFHLSTKTGPNGHALFQSLSDLYCLPDTLISAIVEIGGDKIKTTIDRLLHPGAKRVLGMVLPILGKSFRRLSYFPDREDKVRVIAIGDYWSQTVLIPLHRYLFRVLKKIPQDCTFDQGSFWEKIKGSEVFYSADLSSATDRFPIDTIGQLLQAKLPPTYVSAWKHIMVGYPFEFKAEDKSVKSLSYSVGNPMGFYSSWASFSVAHHYIVYYCCREAGLPWKDVRYCLLGDDIVIANREIGERYLRVISSLGVEVSKLKTHQSDKLLEFAKRWYLNSEEITPFPISALFECGKKYYLLTNLLMESERKGWVTREGIPSSVALYFGLIKQMPSRFRKVIELNSTIVELITRVVRGLLPADVAMNCIIRKLDYPIRQLSQEESHGILENIVVESFADSNPENDSGTKGVGLGTYAINLVCYLTEPDIAECAGGLETTDLPILQAYGQVEQTFLDLKKEAFRISTTGGGDWPLLLKTMALPLDDRIFVERQSHLIVKASAIIGKKLRERFVFLSSPLGRQMLG